MRILFAALHESGCGTKRTRRDRTRTALLVMAQRWMELAKSGAHRDPLARSIRASPASWENIGSVLQAGRKVAFPPRWEGLAHAQRQNQFSGVQTGIKIQPPSPSARCRPRRSS